MPQVSLLPRHRISRFRASVTASVLTATIAGLVDGLPALAQAAPPRLRDDCHAARHPDRARAVATHRLRLPAGARAIASTAPGSGRYGVLRLSRWTVAVGPDGNPSGLNTEVPILETSAGSDAHGITGLVAAHEGTVWLSIATSADWRVMDPLTLRVLARSSPHPTRKGSARTSSAAR